MPIVPKTLVSEYSPTLTVDVPPTAAETPNPPSTSEAAAPDTAGLSKERTVQMTFVESHVSLATENEAFVPEDQMSDLPCELLYHLES
jgi:hypothetical protein